MTLPNLLVLQNQLYVDTLFVLGIHQIDLCDFFFNIGFVVVCFCYLFVSTFIVFKWGGV